MSDKVTCPKCGAENYANDVVCLSCGESLKAPAPSAQPTAQAEEGPRKPQEPEAKAASPAGFLVKALLVSLAAAAVEFVLIALLNKDHSGPGGVYFVPMPKGVGGVILGVLLWGALRGGILGGLLIFTRWSPTIALLIGAAMGYAFISPAGAWETILGGAVVGLIVGVMREQLD